MAIKAECYDNRGDSAYAYGFVYFNDDRRVAYTSGPEGGQVHIDANGGWGEVTTVHAKVAEEYLKKEGVL